MARLTPATGMPLRQRKKVQTVVRKEESARVQEPVQAPVRQRTMEPHVPATVCSLINMEGEAFFPLQSTE